MALTKFGQYVHLSIKDGAGGVVFETDSLRVDFEVFNIKGFNKGKVDIYNLEPDTIRNISNGECYVTIKTALHDSEQTILMSDMFVSNAISETKVPNEVTSLYCYSKLAKDVLEKDISVAVTQPNLRRMVTQILAAAGFGGSVTYKFFPDEILAYVPPKPVSKQEGSAKNCLDLLGVEYRFNSYIDGTNMVIMYRPDDKNLSSSPLNSAAEDIVLDTNNMRENPKLGPAQLQVVSNLDPNIKPTSVLDVTRLLTAGTNTDQDTLRLAQDYLTNSVAGFSKYVALTVVHSGSNYADLWSTTVMATSPVSGTRMPTNKWWL